VRVVVEWIDAPVVARPVVVGVLDAHERRVAHLHVGRRHIDLRAEYPLTRLEFACAHAPVELEALFDGTLPVGALLAHFLNGAAVLLRKLLFGEVADVRAPEADQLFAELVEALEVVRRVIHVLPPIEPEPAHVALNRLDVLHVFGRRVRVVHAQVTAPAEFARNAEIDANRLRVPDVEVAVRFRRKPRDDLPAVRAGGDVGAHHVPDEIVRRGLRHRARF
jgi:hypothetical protein